MDKRTMLQCLVNHYSNGNQAQFAAKLGIPAQNISAWIKRNTFNAELIYEKCEGVSADWLLCGEGEMMRELHNVDTNRTDNALLELCKLLIANYQQRDDIMCKLIAKTKSL